MSHRQRGCSRVDSERLRNVQTSPNYRLQRKTPRWQLPSARLCQAHYVIQMQRLTRQINADVIKGSKYFWWQRPNTDLRNRPEKLLPKCLVGKEQACLDQLHQKSRPRPIHNRHKPRRVPESQTVAYQDARQTYHLRRADRANHSRGGEPPLSDKVCLDQEEHRCMAPCHPAADGDARNQRRMGARTARHRKDLMGTEEISGTLRRRPLYKCGKHLDGRVRRPKSHSNWRLRQVHRP